MKVRLDMKSPTLTDLNMNLLLLYKCLNVFLKTHLP